MDNLPLLIEELAFVRGRSLDEIQTLVAAAGGDLEINSKEGQVIAIRIEERLSMPGLIRPEDQEPENLTSLSSLGSLIERRRSAVRPQQAAG